MSSGVEASDELDRRLKEVDALRRRVLNVIPHALRTPITTFRGLSDALPTASDEDIRTRITPALQRLAAQAEHLLDDMLIASGLTTTLPTGERKPTPVHATVLAVWADVRREHGDIHIVGDDAEVLVVSHGLFKILVHVLDNAAKYGSEAPTVRLERNEHVRISVDSPGPQVGEIELLVEPFFRSERAVMLGAGLGVGLTVARALAEHADGSLVVAPLDGGGLTTIIELEPAR